MNDEEWKNKEMKRMYFEEKKYMEPWSPERSFLVNQMCEIILNSYLTRFK